MPIDVAQNLVKHVYIDMWFFFLFISFTSRYPYWILEWVLLEPIGLFFHCFFASGDQIEFCNDTFDFLVVRVW